MIKTDFRNIMPYSDQIENVNDCDPICFANFTCDWSNLNNPSKYAFPDGTYQTCVGSQVRCGCTFIMRLTSYFTYEHPSSVISLFLLFCATLVIMLLRWAILRFCVGPSMNPRVDKPGPAAINANSSHTVIENTGSDIVTIFFSSPPALPPRQTPSYAASKHISYSDPPPPYSETLVAEQLPPQYSECISYPGAFTDQGV